MDVERTIEFILRMQAESETRMAKFDERMAKADERMAKAEERMEKFDKRLEATRKVVEVGMKLLVRIDKKHLELAKQISALTEAQRKSDRKFDRFIASWERRGSNGHGPKS